MDKFFVNKHLNILIQLIYIVMFVQMVVVVANLGTFVNLVLKVLFEMIFPNNALLNTNNPIQTTQLVLKVLFEMSLPNNALLNTNNPSQMTQLLIQEIIL